MLSRLAMLLRLSDCLFSTFRCQPALVRVLVTLCASAMVEFMPYATRSCLWRDFDLPLRPGCHHPSYHSDVLVKTASATFGFACYSYFSLSPSVSASAVLLSPSSFFGPSPCLLTAGAYCRTLFHRCDCFLRKERDSNPRCSYISEASALLHVLTFCFRPLSHPSEKSDYSHEPSDYTV